MIFLGGLGRSGSTLLERLLGEVPGVVPLGEVVHLWARGVLGAEPCGCGVSLPGCGFWCEVGRRAFGGWAAELATRMIELRRLVDRTRHIPPRPSLELVEYVSVYRRLYTAAADVAGGNVVVDSSKHASLAFCLAAAGVPVHVVHMVRDPRAVAHSWRRRITRPEDGTPMPRWSPFRTAAHWTAQNLALELLAGKGVPVTRVRYEDLLDAPRPAFARLLTSLDLAPRLDFLTGRHARLTTAHTASGNPMRFSSGEVELVRDDAWRQALPRAQRVLVTALTLPLMIQYGYRARAAA
ncbi:sulfotransferase [Spongiactinospora sp. TRM90649]|uniref:sulfotransferase n=1 Tax=Spongiactinospora sp. TRM90649 TaxID=3031114 RepID=UPI0023F99177|nr:sulfotransferase [Spongiactinospora sp. TRM90649]MDF5754809.1 sulfotransferase [Spongiactinospora sp. TRM90649]